MSLFILVYGLSFYILDTTEEIRKGDRKADLQYWYLGPDMCLFIIGPDMSLNYLEYNRYLSFVLLSLLPEIQ